MLRFGSVSCGFGCGRVTGIGSTLLVAAVVSGCATETETRAYVERLGVDTMAVEVFTRTPDRIAGDLIARSPVTRYGQYTATLDSEGRIERFDLNWQTPHENPEGPPDERFLIRFGDDSATVEHYAGESVDTTRVNVPPGTIPSTGRLPLSVAMWEQAIRQAMASGAEEYEFSLYTPGRPQAATSSISRRSADTVALDFFGSPMLAEVDEQGRILGASGRETTLKVEVESVDPTTVDLSGLAADFAVRDARGEGIGRASPEQTVEASGGGANFEVVYSRPAMRGREIWGGLVPYGEVWRTGANAATHLSTDRDLWIGDAEVPAGTYTLWTIFTSETAELIINEQTQIWGTAYDASADLARVPLESETLDQPVERFTIEIQPTDEGGVLRLSWDTTRFSVPMRVQ